MFVCLFSKSLEGSTAAGRLVEVMVMVEAPFFMGCRANDAIIPMTLAMLQVWISLITRLVSGPPHISLLVFSPAFSTCILWDFRSFYLPHIYISHPHFAACRDSQTGSLKCSIGKKCFMWVRSLIRLLILKLVRRVCCRRTPGCKINETHLFVVFASAF